MKTWLFISSISALSLLFLIGCSDTASQVREIQKKYEQVKAANEVLKEAEEKYLEKIRELEESMIHVREDVEKERLAWKRLYSE